jgi:hypothetical protein
MRKFEVAGTVGETDEWVERVIEAEGCYEACLAFAAEVEGAFDFISVYYADGDEDGTAFSLVDGQWVDADEGLPAGDGWINWDMTVGPWA